ncbi:PREDICTED: tankyrase-1-like [Priapulus caudatus]|uniref:Tankyrase-1-like n=1 Tax=Priapulus caudatus TaxID=37621 RepID=A0ABM1ER84_PRICU|nr:PREDICTED: tankyrase-1-like [Priapulus caudatus]XP_014674683.1 PREDICTED: tankyrase-1-like [Priapulus caudatus]XP_014674692.1 PREDICTED: tankyrase-1-like [Priapulus caudatus]XP_014674700.1 PREDICTED: tankyrase-1-like [Priapulus caudatus]XP_014674705.1 PREDICTED: tankyrase-1-like [Priapulus caudatus]
MAENTPPEGAASCEHMSNITALTNACCSGDKLQVRALLQLGVPLDRPDMLGLTPLQRAARNGLIDIVDLLLQHGADVGVANESREGALHFAASYGYAQIVGLLLQFGADANARDVDGRTPLHAAVSEGFADATHVLLRYGADRCVVDDAGMTALHLAASLGHLAIAKLLLTPREARPTAAYCRADDAGNVPKLETIVKMLARHANSAFVNAADRKSRTALHFAVWRSAEFTVFLLQNGADPNSVDGSGCTAFHVACMEPLKHNALILLSYGADPVSASRDGRTPMHVLVTDMLIYLSRLHGLAGAQQQQVVLPPQKLTVLHILKVLIAYPLHIDVPDREGFTAFGLWQEVYMKRTWLYSAYFDSVNVINERMNELFFFKLKCVAARAATKYRLPYNDPELLHKHLVDLVGKHDKYAIER